MTEIQTRPNAFVERDISFDKHAFRNVKKQLWRHYDVFFENIFSIRGRDYSGRHSDSRTYHREDSGADRIGLSEPSNYSRSSRVSPNNIKFIRFKIKCSLYFNALHYGSFRDHGWDADAVAEKLAELQKKGLVVAMDNGAFTRVVHQDVQIQVSTHARFHLLLAKQQKKDSNAQLI